MYEIVLTKRVQKQLPLLKSAHLDGKVKTLLEVLHNNPFQNPPPYEKLMGEYRNLYSRRINFQHRLVYRVDEDVNTVVIISMWTHYETI